MSGAELTADPFRDGGQTLFQDGVRQSYVDVDPTRLAFVYTQWVADSVDSFFPAGRALRVVHLGGGALTLPRWLAATRPASTSTVFELDPAVAGLAARTVDAPGTTVQVGDAGAGIAALGDTSADLIIGDAFDGRRVPPHLLTQRCTRQVARVLAPDGLYVLNVIDDPPFPRLTGAVAALRSVFPAVGLVAQPSLLARVSGGNAVIAAAAALDAAAWAERVGRRAEPASVLTPHALGEWCDAARWLPDEPQRD